VVDGTLIPADSAETWVNALCTFRHLFELWTAINVLEHKTSYSPDRCRREEALLRRRIGLPEPGGIQYGVQLLLPEELQSILPPRGRWDHRWDAVAAAETGAWRHPVPEERVRQAARHVLADQINRALDGRLGLLLSARRHGGVRFVPKGWLSAALYLLALEAAGRSGTQRPCDNPRCQRDPVFLPTRRDQRYCSKQCREIHAYHRRQDARRSAPVGKRLR